MRVYLARKLLLALLLLAALSFASFWVVAAHINPLYPLFLQSPLPVAQIHKLTLQSHLKDAIPTRYWLWIEGIVTGRDAGHSVLTHTPVWPPVWRSFLITGELAVGALVTAVVIGVATGALAAQRQGGRLDRGLRAAGYFTWSIPVFVTALVLQAAFARLQTSTGLHPLLLSGRPAGSGLAYVASWYRHMTLPVAAVALSCIGLYSRYVRSAMLVSLAAPYTVVARGKGLPESAVVRRHALRNALVPLVAALTIDFSALIGTTLAVDIVFGLGGLGGLFLQSLELADPFQLEALLFVTVFSVVVLTLLADAVYGWLDPQMRRA